MATRAPDDASGKRRRKAASAGSGSRPKKRPATTGGAAQAGKRSARTVGRSPAKGRSASRAGASGKTAQASRPRKKRVVLPPPPPLAFQIAIYVALAGGSAMLLYACGRVLWAIGAADLNPLAAAMMASGMLGGVAATVMVGLLAMYSFDPKAHPLQRINKVYMAYGVVATAMLAVVVAVAVPQLLLLIIPALVPAAAVLFMVVRPRMRAIGVARGRPAPLTFSEKRLKALEEARQEREKQRAAAEQYEKLKQRRRREGGRSAG